MSEHTPEPTILDRLNHLADGLDNLRDNSKDDYSRGYIGAMIEEVERISALHADMLAAVTAKSDDTLKAKHDEPFAKIPMLNGNPEIIEGMKYKFIGQFSWKEEAPYYDARGEVHDYIAQYVVPWDICKYIYKQMALFAVENCER